MNKIVLCNISIDSVNFVKRILITEAEKNNVTLFVH
jgi:hypothetical protein